MSTQLDILALEPFYGGIRRHMLETVIRYSRHRWTLLRLPPRRMERRLMTAAHWFAEQLSRHWAGRTDLLLSSEAMNLADLFRLVPELSQKPSVVYFHSNQLPEPGAEAERAWELVNLSTASAATELWFNSMYHLKAFMARATAVVERHPELSGRNPMPGLVGKAHLMPPPIDLSLLHQAAAAAPAQRQKRTIFVETRDANIRLLNSALLTLIRRGENLSLITVGPVDDLSPDLPRRTLPEADDVSHMQALQEAGIILSTKLAAPFDHHAVRALTMGCWPILPRAGVYPELLPPSLHGACLYDNSTDALAGHLLDAWHLERPTGYRDALDEILQHFDAIAACKAMDERLEEIVVAHSVQ